MKKLHGDAVNNVLGVLLRLPVDILLVTFAGFLCVLTTVYFYRGANTWLYTYFLRDEHGFDVVNLTLSAIFLIGSAQIAVAIIRLRGFFRINFDKVNSDPGLAREKIRLGFTYLVCLVFLLLCNFVIGIILTELRSQIPDSLESIMRPKLLESMASQQSLGIGYGLSDRWDRLQVQMACCGVEGYKDYMVKDKPLKDQNIPMSCCVMRTVQTVDGGMVAENPSQCLLDASHGLEQSIFLNSQGCRSPLARWAVARLAQMTALMFAAICFQAVTLLYLSWHGFQRQSVMSWR